jgi:hypothetical protein
MENEGIRVYNDQKINGNAPTIDSFFLVRKSELVSKIALIESVLLYQDQIEEHNILWAESLWKWSTKNAIRVITDSDANNLVGGGNIYAGDLEASLLHKLVKYKKGIAKSVLKGNSFRKISHDDFNKAVNSLARAGDIVLIAHNGGHILKIPTRSEKRELQKEKT